MTTTGTITFGTSGGNTLDTGSGVKVVLTGAEGAAFAIIMARVPDAAKTFDGLKAHKVLIKNVSKMHPLLANCLRLTVGTAAENDQLLAALKVSL